MIEKARLIKERVEGLLNVDLSSKSRKRELVEARAVYYKVAQEKTDVTLYTMSSLVGKNHATALHGINNVFPYLEHYNKGFYNMYLDLMNESCILAEVRNKVNKLDYNKLETLNNYLDEITK